ncbi:glutathione S-transferase [Teratosphaeria destructans]|uniref:Glutathione S-transferase n=1 Tax=Teratosphaeria destructans TaxID=418781 RepID=A0A9W7VYN2_9PEZI|nr:glutathione S-transferase [Teratosphaeria destructans]
MSITIISATPSPYARINRIALIEKGIPFKLQVTHPSPPSPNLTPLTNNPTQTEIPWHPDTQTPTHNPLEKLPVLLFSDGRAPVYDSSHIQRWIVTTYATRGPRLITGDVDTDLRLEQIQVLSQGVMDAVVLAFFEKAREAPSRSWWERQMRKVEGGFRAFEALAGERAGAGEGAFLVAGQLTIADIAVGCAVGFVEFNGALPGWRERFPRLSEYWARFG